jgi:hypothetical protein
VDDATGVGAGATAPSPNILAFAHFVTDIPAAEAAASTAPFSSSLILNITTAIASLV